MNERAVRLTSAITAAKDSLKAADTQREGRRDTAVSTAAFDRASQTAATVAIAEALALGHDDLVQASAEVAGSIDGLAHSLAAIATTLALIETHLRALSEASRAGR